MSLLQRTHFARALLRSRATVASPALSIFARSYTTPSEEAAKADKHSKSPEQLQKETVGSQKKGGEDSKITASPNKQPTESEDAVHAEKHAANKTPGQLQKETVNKQQN